MSDNNNRNNENTSTDQGTTSGIGLIKGGQPKRTEEEVYDRQIRLWGADAQVGNTSDISTSHPEE